MIVQAQAKPEYKRLKLLSQESCTSRLTEPELRPMVWLLQEEDLSLPLEVLSTRQL